MDTCQRHGCNRPRFDSWKLKFCALPEEGVREIAVCRECDLELNETSVRFWFGDTKERELREYREAMLLPTPLTLRQRIHHGVTRFLEDVIRTRQIKRAPVD